MAVLKLDESRWVLGGGRTEQWRRVNRLRRDDVYAALRMISREWKTRAPASARRRDFGAGLTFFLGAKSAARDRLAVHPALDYWLYLWDAHFARPTPLEDWELHFGVFQSFPAALALETGGEAKLDACLDPQGRFYVYGTPCFIEFPQPRAARAPARVIVARGVLRITAEGGFSATLDPREAAVRGPLKRLHEVVPGVVVDDRGWLQVHGVTMHGLETLDDPARERFASVLRAALGELAEHDPLLHAEIMDLLRVVVPLKNPMNHGSVSSSYVNMRGMIAMSHAEDSLLQAETFIHEFCHMKMNQLLAVDPVILPGQAGQVYYSPWRADPRRLRGLLLGGHAFLNVARYLARSLQREEYEAERRLDVMANVARRISQVETALKALAEHARLTEFGREFILGMWRELGLLKHAALWYPVPLLEEQRAACEEHRRTHGLGDTALHKSAALVDNIPRDRFRKPGEPEEDSVCSPRPVKT